MSAEEPIWSGVYESFAAVSGAPVFEQATWLGKESQRAAARLAALDRGDPLLRREDLLATVAGTLPRPARILDFGGGLGTAWGDLHQALGVDGFELDVVESPALCALGAQTYAGRRGLRFHAALLEGRYDLVHSRSAIHYVEDWRGLLAALAGRSDALLALVDVPAGPIDTFITAQRFYGRDIPVRFFNEAELVAQVEALGFRHTYRAHRLATIRGVEGPLQMAGLPLARRIDHMVDLLFRRQ